MSWKTTQKQAEQYRLTTEQVVKAKEQYHAQRKTAAKRGIEWHFTFESWIQWWIGQAGYSWQAKRGRTVNALCMQRSKDVGPYATWNVSCGPATKNCSDRRRFGSAAKQDNVGVKNPKAKLTEQMVTEIFYAKGTLREIGEKYGIGLGSVWGIKHKKNWIHVVRSL